MIVTKKVKANSSYGIHKDYNVGDMIDVYTTDWSGTRGCIDTVEGTVLPNGTYVMRRIVKWNGKKPVFGPLLPPPTPRNITHIDELEEYYKKYGQKLNN